MKKIGRKISPSIICQAKMKTSIARFLKVAALAGVRIDPKKIIIRELGCPHEPQGLPRGKMGIYVFHRGDLCLKIGKAGVKSKARFFSQHYASERANSNLAKSLLCDLKLKNEGFSEDGIGAWIRKNTRRTDILLDETLDIWTHNLLEAFLHCRYRPVYEGYRSQTEES